MNMQFLKRSLALFSAFSFAGLAGAATITWDGTKADGTYDLSAADTWGGSVPTAADEVHFPEQMSGRNYTFTASEDLEFMRFWVTFGRDITANGDGNTITLDLGADRTMTLTGVADSAAMRLDGQNSTLALKSGTVRVKEGGGYPTYFTGNALRNNNTILVDGPKSRLFIDGVKFASPNSLFCVTNGGFVQGALIASQVTDHVTNVTIRVTGEGSLWNLHTNMVKAVAYDLIQYDSPLVLAATKRRDGTWLGGQENHVLLQVDNKGVVTNFCGYVGGDSAGARVLIDDATVYGRDALNIGRASTATNNAVEIRNGGLLTGVSEFHVGQEGQYNRLDVKDGGRLSVGEGLYVGLSGSRNAMCVDNAAVTSQWLRVGENATAKGNTLDVTNGGTMEVRSIWLNQAKDLEVGRGGFWPFFWGSENRITIAGEGSQLAFYGYAYAGGTNSLSATSNRIEVVDGGKLLGRLHSTSKWAVLYLHGLNNTIQARDGGQIEADQVTLGITSKGTNSVSNALEIMGENSSVVARHLFYMNGVGNRCTISNGLLQASTGNATMRFSDATAFTSTSFVNLQGKTPRMRAGKFSAQNTTFTFTVPEGGFTTGPIIKATESLTIADSCTLTVEADEKSSGTAILLQCAKGLTLGDAAVNLTGRRARFHRIEKSTDGTQLLLKPVNGFMVIVR